MRIHYEPLILDHPDEDDQDFLNSVFTFMIRTFKYPPTASFNYSGEGRIGIDYVDFTLDSRPLFCDLYDPDTYPYMTIDSALFHQLQTP